MNPKVGSFILGAIAGMVIGVIAGMASGKERYQLMPTGNPAYAWRVDTRTGLTEMVNAQGVVVGKSPASNGQQVP
jgi:hypothetical protein